jgi:hypothetical protein
VLALKSARALIPAVRRFSGQNRASLLPESQFPVSRSKFPDTAAKISGLMSRWIVLNASKVPDLPKFPRYFAGSHGTRFAAKFPDRREFGPEKGSRSTASTATKSLILQEIWWVARTRAQLAAFRAVIFAARILWRTKVVADHIISKPMMMRRSSRGAAAIAS